MCGIFCSIIQCNREHCIDTLNICETLLKGRGPDKQNTVIYKSLKFYSSVLWQQGHEPCVQPIDSNGIIFLFNGDIFMDGEAFEDESDTKWLFNKICMCTNESELLNLFKIVRDSLGRNSLLLSRINDEIILSSVFNFKIDGSDDRKPLTIEIPPLGLYCIDLNNGQFHLFSWNNISSVEFYTNQINQIEKIIQGSIEIRNETVDLDWLKKAPQTDYNFEKLLEDYKDRPFQEIFHKLLNNDLLVTNTVDHLIDLLTVSVRERIEKTPNLCRQCLLEKNSECTHARIGILFSGGLDCTILAILADKLIDKNIPIDLLNVAFEKARKGQQNGAPPINFNVPDRVSAIASAQELKSLCPNRQWNLIEINIFRSELKDKLYKRISSLVWPLNSVLDESLGAALWFAARGEGHCNGVPYKSQSRVLLIGSGADEMFGGYTRHRNAFVRENNLNATTTLERELEMDWMRLPSRNLARDDRAIGDHGITPRAPYLQEDVVKFVRSLAPLQKCYHHLEQGVGDKLLLRLCGYKLGLRNAAALKKRALQFGSRIADSKQNATDLSEFLS